jgi:predicted lipoprotein
MTSNPVKQALLPLVLLSAACLLLSGCKIERKSEEDKRKSTSVAGSFENRAFNPRADVDAMWDAKVMPTLEKMATAFPALKQAMTADLDAAGARHGHRAKVEGAPWNLVTRIRGQVVAAETELSAGTADIDVDGDGKADLQLQIGPVVKGTAIRDVLPFISFSDYTNQIDFAQLANAFNERAAAAALASIEREKLVGRQVEAIGVFSVESTDEPPLVTLVSFKVEGP